MEVSRILAIDPGPEQSAWLFLQEGEPDHFGIYPNQQLLDCLRKPADGFATFRAGVDVVVIEKIASFGMAVGAEVFDTVHWSGRFTEACRGTVVHQLTRMAVKMHLCHSPKAKDSNIRQALIDRAGGPETIRKGGPLYGISKDVWSALAVAVTYAEGGR